MTVSIFNNNYKGKKVLITGNTGFKGSWLSLWLLKLGAEVYGVSNEVSSKPSMFEVLNLEGKINHFNQDIRNAEKTQQIIGDLKPDYVFHLAAQAIVSLSYNNPIDTISTNVIGTANVLEALRKSNHSCVGIVITSDKCYKNVEWSWGYREVDKLGGKDIYSGSKGAAELIFNSYFHSFFKNKNSKISVASARAGNVIGGGDWAKDRIIPDCIRAWSSNEVVVIRSPNATRPWQHVLEPLSGYLALGSTLFEKKALNGESFNFGPNSQINQPVSTLLSDLGHEWGFSDLSKAFQVKDDEKFHEASLLKLNCDKAQCHIGWFPTLVYQELIDYTASWYNQYYNGKTNMLEFSNKQIKRYEELAIDRDQIWIKAQ